MLQKSFRKPLLILFSAAVALGAVLAFVGIIQFRGNALKEPCELYVSRNADYRMLTDSLLPHLRHKLAFRLYAKRLQLSENFKPGHYALQPKMNVIEVVRTLKLGLQTPVRVTMNNVRTMPQLAGKLAGQIDADSVELLRTLTLFSMFLPDTYELWWTTTPDELVDRMKREYDRFWRARATKSAAARAFRASK